MSAFLSKLTPFAQESIVADATVKTLTAATYDATAEALAQTLPTNSALVRKKARAAQVIVDSANAIRATEEGTNPVAATTGIVYNQNDAKILESYEAITKFKFTREPAANSLIQVIYYR